MTYDLICIGTGSGGIALATTMNQFGFKVLVIDKTDSSIGGDCLNFGCVPSKALIHVARKVRDANLSKRFGLDVTQGKADMRIVKEYINGKKDVIRVHENASYYRKIGIDVALGIGKFASSNSVEVDGMIYSSKKIVICTGSSPRNLKIPGIELAKVYTNETIFDLDTLPEHLVVIGGGPIGMELGQAFRYLGSKVTFLIRSNRFLPKEDPEIVAVLKEQLKKDGIEIMFETSPKEITSSNEMVVETKDDEKKTLKFDAILSAIGRSLITDHLSLEKTGVAVNDRGGLLLDDYLTTTNPRIFACGDMAGGLQFTHAAEQHARLLMYNWFSPIKKKLNTDTFPWVTFTSPEIATWGLNEATLKERGLKFEVINHDFTNDDRAIVDENTSGKLKLFVSGNKLLGGTMVAENAGELAQELMLLNSSGTSLKTIFNKLYPYPAATRVNQFAIMPRYLKKTVGYKWLLKLLYR
jgi:pyruvate/2-oxoglutarate dehydrogenase complex dihydrolipoamide dehydrogenase (E3) component